MTENSQPASPARRSRISCSTLLGAFHSAAGCCVPPRPFIVAAARRSNACRGVSWSESLSSASAAAAGASGAPWALPCPALACEGPAPGRFAPSGAVDAAASALLGPAWPGAHTQRRRCMPSPTDSCSSPRAVATSCASARSKGFSELGKSTRPPFCSSGLSRSSNCWRSFSSRFASCSRFALSSFIIFSIFGGRFGSCTTDGSGGTVPSSLNSCSTNTT
mmetsp:Transcript_121382/g.234161  ORF Transcript_121382/g.234161 Transcript_121382/m.234161 type:complete len:220 (-) Transcript_121382:89-748(-)